MEIIFLSLPVFYIWGFISFIKWVSKGRKGSATGDRKLYLENEINQLTQVVKKSPSKKVSALLLDYVKELESITKTKIPLVPITEGSTPEAQTTAETPIDESKKPEEKPSVQEDISKFWENWYSDNSINLLLYIGAFLIVASASIFVGFQWEAIGGSIKAGLLSALTLAFFAFGTWFYSIPKIKNAGATFLAIGALLIPFNGLAWYNFVMQPFGYTIGGIWFITSITAVLIYAILAYFIRHPFYTYIAGFGGLSTILSIVNVSDLNQEFYVLGGIFSAFVLLLSTKLFSRIDEQVLKTYLTPLSVSAHVIMPLSLIWGLFFAISGDRLFTIEVVASAFLASLYYLLAYLFSNENSYLTIGATIFPLSVLLFGKWLGLDFVTNYYALEVVFLIYLVVAYYLCATGQKAWQTISESLTIIPLMFAAAIFVVAFATEVSAFHLTAFAVFPTVYGLLAAYYQKTNVYFFYNFFFLAISIYSYLNNMLGLDDKFYLTGAAYVGISVILYLITLSTKNIRGSFEAFSVGTGFFTLLAILFTFEEPLYFLLSNVVAAVILLDYAIRFKKYDLIYLSNLFIYVALWSVLRSSDVRISHYPFYFAGLSYLVYLLSQIMPENLKNFYRLTSLVGVGTNTLLFGFLGLESNTYLEYEYSSKPNLEYIDLERNALASSYASFFLYSFDAATYKKAALGYFASAVGILTYLWQMKYLGFAETQVYTLPVGVYFITLAYLQRVKGNLSNQDLLNYAGLFFLLIPTLFQSFGDNGAKYALLLGVEGVIIFALGNSLRYKSYIYAGIGAIVLAVISQTYEFVFSLPRWLITAIAGLAFLSTAIYLLLHRKEEHN